MTGIDLDAWTERGYDPDAIPRKYARRAIAGIIATCCVLLLATTGHEPTDNGRHATAVHTITEDDPAWNCATMGNHVCGPCR